MHKMVLKKSVHWVRNDESFKIIKSLLLPAAAAAVTEEIGVQNHYFCK